MLSLTHNLKIGDLVFPAVENVKIESSRETISDVMTIVLPKYKRLSRSDLTEGTPVRFECGYSQYGMNVELEGIVREVTPRQPFEITVEDYFYYLRRDYLSKTFRRMFAGDIIKQICAGTPVDTTLVQQGVYLSHRVYWKKSKRYIIQNLAKLCGFDAYMSGKYLVFDKPFKDCDSMPVGVYRYGINVIDENISFSPDTEFDKVVVISEHTDGTGKIFSAVEGSGNRVKTIYLDDLSRQQTISRAKEIYDELSYTGFTGDFTTFGYPPTWHSRKIKYTDDRYPEKSGYYSVNSVEKEYGGRGFRQKIFLEQKIA